ncbi:MAG: amino acid ABC transporter permease [Burkholderiales bacterium]|nr:amino acid ABC transporter permease [Burkholderiales bacterium]
MELQFAPVVADASILIAGLWLTAKLSLAAIILGSMIGLAAAIVRTQGPPGGRWSIDAYVELIRNTPFLVQLYIIFFGLPAIGIRMPAEYAGLLAMTINLGAYTAEIFRAGIESVHRSQIEAGLSLAMTRGQIFRHVILRPALARVWPSLTSQYILIMLASSVCSFISVEELSGGAALIQSNTFRSLEVYLLVTAIYLGLALVLKGLLAIVGRVFLQLGNRTGRDRRRHASPAASVAP